MCVCIQQKISKAFVQNKPCLMCSTPFNDLNQKLRINRAAGWIIGITENLEGYIIRNLVQNA